ncbi:uncharacterized protein LOC131944591 [Physella acuta]|uniref:uncharacterized protein LOC131944591 n=1 Tax=Physella acuta TaxID=109671 RepID=UPI0027DBA275|nr:uncharacterized protein LOC131944591 [Physella acuta]
MINFVFFSGFLISIAKMNYYNFYYQNADYFYGSYTSEENKACLQKKCSHACLRNKGVESCLCPDGLELDKAAQASCVVPYYPYGEAAGDLRLENSGNANPASAVLVSNAIKFSSGAPFGDTHQPAAYVMSNGVFGFGDKPNPSGVADLNWATEKGLNFVAPYWTDMDPTIGQVYYQTYERFGSIFPDFESNKESPNLMYVLARAEKDVKENFFLTGFTAIKVMVITWENVAPFSLKAKKSEYNTIQAIYITGWETAVVKGVRTYTNEESAFVLFHYQQGNMNWNYVPGRQISIGTSGGKSQNNMKDLNSPVVTNLDKMQTNEGNQGIVGYVVGKVSGPDVTCLQYLSNYIYLLDDVVFWHERQQLYKCPCTLERLGNQWQLYEKRGANGDIYCYALSQVAKRRLMSSNTRNMLCCYKWKKSVSTDWKHKIFSISMLLQLCCYKWKKPASTDWKLWLQTWREAAYLPPSPESGHLLITDPWSVGSFGYYKALENIHTHELCCSQASQAKYCDSFYKIFADKGCSNFVLFVPASALGDPTITTLDGLNYAMNGWGEYCMMKVDSENFIIQARTGRVETAAGNLSSATVFIGFAVKESTTTFQILLSPSNTTMVLTANSIDITNDFYRDSDSDIILSSDSLQITREYKSNKTFAVVNFICGVTIHVHVAVKSLEIMFEVPKDLQGKTRGLLGNFNGDKTDEFITPDGQVLSANLSEREIFQQFSQKWAVNNLTTLFTHGPGEKAEDFQHPEFTPMFKDEAKPEDVAKAVEICGDKNDACIFDFLATGDQAFAENTKSFSEEMAVTVEVLANNPPKVYLLNDTLNSNGRWMVSQGSYSTIHPMAVDDDGDSVTFELIGNFSGISIDLTGQITYMPDIKYPVLLQVRVKDTKGAYSPVLYIPITVCPACSGHGQCNTNTTRTEEYYNGRFQILTCDCWPAYKGEECDTELNACAVEPCSRGQNCTDLTAAQQGNNSIGYVCGPCPVGFVDMRMKCVDIDECNDTLSCDQLCTNTEGSYTCGCQSGYRLDHIDKKTCLEINECEERTSNCQHKCINTKGSYSCSCLAGYTLEADGFTCTIDAQLKDVCSQCQQVCSITNGQVNCTCKLGYEVDPDNPLNCRDVNECEFASRPCSQSCVNKPGTFQCSCYSGFTLAPDGLSCTACTIPQFGMNCESTCQCSGHGSCDTIRGCVCDNNWSGDHCDVDVDECAQSTSCPEGFLCKNKIGSFSCLCPDGYKLDNGTCIDIDECKDISTTTNCDRSLEVCVNTVGSYSCSCKKGYARNAQSICEDINECEKKVDKCEQICDNKPGSYNCLCQQGFYLSDDRWTCVKVKDPCVGQKINCSYGCGVDADNVATCYCPRGFLLKDTELCADINECLSDTDNDCTIKSNCVNTDGSYTCSCPAGSKLDNDGRSCIACSGETWGVQCNQTCGCGQGADHCDPATGCVCKSGYTGAICSVDIDECSEDPHKCSSSETCRNVPGSYTCDCQTGFTRNNGACEDVNECSSPTTNKCTQLCENTVGGYSCSCYLGFTYNITDNTCSDINECEVGTARCEQICANTAGSYRCSCSADLKLLPDGFTCRATIPCTTKTTCSYQCATINDTETCLCPKGTTLAADGLNCDDEDLCSDSTCIFGCAETFDNTSIECVCPIGMVLSADKFTCLDIDLCVNNTCTFGCIETNENTSTKCVCPAGQKMDTDGETCIACVEGSWGTECNNTCSCSVLGTSTCDKVSGTCQCKSGWSGIDCDKDVDECLQNTNICPSHSHCNNTEGGFLCPCDDGFFQSITNCEACVEGSWGTECNNTCSCSVLGTSTCDKVSGTCQCKSGWSGTDCDKDVDECLQNTNICPSHSHCNNTEGGFLCPCDDGFFQSITNCEACVEGSWGTECSNNCSCSVLGTSTCDKVSGTCQCKSGWSGTNCDKDVDECLQNTTNCPSHSHCSNTEGSFDCLCDDGFYRKNSTSQNCEACDEFYFGTNCSQHCICNTSQHEYCKKTDTVYTCACDKGYERKCNACSCEDVDECASLVKPCEQNCTNSNGSFECSCQDGYTISQTNSSACHVVSTQDMKITFNIDVAKLNLEDKNSDDYIKTKVEVEDQMFKELKAKKLPVVKVNCKNLSKGSLIADLEILIDQILQSSPSQALIDAIQLIMAQGLTLNNSTVLILNLNINNKPVSAATCTVRQKNNPCKTNEECVEVDGTTVCVINTKDDLQITLGLSIGLSLFTLACACIGIVTYCCIKKKIGENKIYVGL